MFSKIVDAATSLLTLKDNSVVAISGFNMATTPEYLILELYDRYHKTGHPKGIFIISDALPAVPGRALDQVAEKLHRDPAQDFLRGVLMPFLAFSPWLQKMITDNLIESYGWPLGIAAYWFREVASGRPGIITKIGLDTFLDPRREGGALNELAEKKISCRISTVNIEGEEYLLYQAPKPDYALIRATTADEIGNLSMQDEGMRGTTFSIAQAVKARPKQGTVLAQVRWLTKSWTMNPRDIDIPGPLVDYVIVAPRKYHWQGATVEYDPRISFRVVPPITDGLVRDINVGAPPNQYERIIARRILLELIRLFEEKRSPILVDLGIGIPALVSSIAAEEQVSEFIITVVESGAWGGIALSGANFGLAMSPFALSTIPDMFSNFEGGIIDAASLGFLQVDREGNVNPSMLPNRIFGPGGFPVIAGGAPRTYFAGAFSAGKAKIDIVNGKLQIIQDGEIQKFVEKVFRVVFSGHQAIKYGHEILYVTERAVFRLAKQGVILEEIAPGVDIDKDIISKMNFVPNQSSSVKQMDERLFYKGNMGTREKILQMLRK
ncbi:MAG: acyl CoA:acetate/3-ketoacid CoA transferase [Thermoproteota archaeon]|nr:acyl CoA:acetate/3-ketoacid CoA transferase [Thermoproteota archaeon]